MDKTNLERHYLRHINRILRENRNKIEYINEVHSFLGDKLRRCFNGWICTNRFFIQEVKEVIDFAEIYSHLVGCLVHDIKLRLWFCDKCRKVFDDNWQPEFQRNCRKLVEELWDFLKKQPDFHGLKGEYRYDYPLTKKARRIINREWYKEKIEPLYWKSSWSISEFGKFAEDFLLGWSSSRLLIERGLTCSALERIPRFLVEENILKILEAEK